MLYYIGKYFRSDSIQNNRIWIKRIKNKSGKRFERRIFNVEFRFLYTFWLLPMLWLVRSKFLMHKWMWSTLNSFKAAEDNQIRNLKYSSKCLNIVNKWKCCIGMPTDKSTYTHGRHKLIHRCTLNHTHLYRQIDTERRKHNETVIQQWEITSIECFSKKDDGITIKINKQDNLLINDHLRASSTSTSASKALMLTMQQVCAASPLFYFINIRCWCVGVCIYICRHFEPE